MILQHSVLISAVILQHPVFISAVILQHPVLVCLSKSGGGRAPAVIL